jgi:hypothetical protein
VRLPLRPGAPSATFHVEPAAGHASKPMRALRHFPAAQKAGGPTCHSAPGRPASVPGHDLTGPIRPLGLIVPLEPNASTFRVERSRARLPRHPTEVRAKGHSDPPGPRQPSAPNPEGPLAGSARCAFCLRRTVAARRNRYQDVPRGTVAGNEWPIPPRGRSDPTRASDWQRGTNAGANSDPRKDARVEQSHWVPPEAAERR